MPAVKESKGEVGLLGAWAVLDGEGMCCWGFYPTAACRLCAGVSVI